MAKNRKHNRNILVKILKSLTTFQKRLLLLLLGLLMLDIMVVRRIIGDKQIGASSKKTVGLVCDIGIWRGSSDVRLYCFEYNGKKYSRYTSSIGYKVIGDTVTIYFHPENPSINRTWVEYVKLQ